MELFRLQRRFQVAAGCRKLLKRPKIDYLLLNPGFKHADNGRETTKDGVEQPVVVSQWLPGSLLS